MDGLAHCIKSECTPTCMFVVLFCKTLCEYAHQTQDWTCYRFFGFVPYMCVSLCVCLSVSLSPSISLFQCMVGGGGGDVCVCARARVGIFELALPKRRTQRFPASGSGCFGP